MNNNIVNNRLPDRKPDIFDRIMSFKLLSWAYPFYEKNREVLLYLFFGALTMFLSIALFSILNVGLHMNEHAANIISWIIVVFFAFVTNRKWVFTDVRETDRSFFPQMLRFYGGRFATLGVEELIILIFITWLHFNSMAVKILAQIVVIVLNYIISKLLVFRADSSDSSD